MQYAQRVIRHLDLHFRADFFCCQRRQHALYDCRSIG